jgi:hypothetical protein
MMKGNFVRLSSVLSVGVGCGALALALWLYVGGNRDGDSALENQPGTLSLPDPLQRRVPPEELSTPKVPAGIPGTLKESMLSRDSLMKAYKTGGLDEIVAKLDAVGPGSKRRDMILAFLSDAAALEGGVSAKEFSEIFHLIDALPYPEDKALSYDADVQRLVRAQATEVVVNTMRSLESKSLQVAFELGLGDSLAAEEGSKIGEIVRQIGENHATVLVCAWAGKLRKNRMMTPDSFETELASAGLSDGEREMAIGAYVNSLVDISGDEIVAATSRVNNKHLSEQLLLKGYDEWLKEDSMAASAALQHNGDGLPNAAYDAIVSRLSSRLGLTGDIQLARQWAATIRDQSCREVAMSLLDREAARSKE